jgi:hypothetical protein
MELIHENFDRSALKDFIIFNNSLLKYTFIQNVNSLSYSPQRYTWYRCHGYKPEVLERKKNKEKQRFPVSYKCLVYFNRKALATWKLFWG